MNILTLLEQLVNMPTFDPKLNTLINNQPQEIKEAFSKNEPNLLKKMFPHQAYFANEQASCRF